MSAEDTLRALVNEGATRSRTRCRICNEETAAEVMLQLRVKANVLSNGKAKYAQGRSVTLCAEHAVTLWEELLERLP